VTRSIVRLVAAYWAMVLLGLIVYSVVRRDDTAMLIGLWSGAVFGTLLGQTLGLFGLRLWVTGLGVGCFLLLGIPQGTADPELRVFWLTLPPATLFAAVGVGDRWSLAAMWFPVALWMLSILELTAGASTPSGTAAVLLGVLAIGVLVFLRARESRRVALWRSVGTITGPLATPHVTLLRKERPGHGLGRTGWTLAVSALAFAFTAWLAPHLWKIESLAGGKVTAIAHVDSDGPTGDARPCCEEVDARRSRVREYFGLGHGRDADHDDPSCRVCNSGGGGDEGEGGDVAWVDAPRVDYDDDLYWNGSGYAGDGYDGTGGTGTGVGGTGIGGTGTGVGDGTGGGDGTGTGTANGDSTGALDPGVRPYVPDPPRIVDEPPQVADPAPVQPAPPEIRPEPATVDPPPPIEPDPRPEVVIPPVQPPDPALADPPPSDPATAPAPATTAADDAADHAGQASPSTTHALAAREDRGLSFLAWLSAVIAAILGLQLAAFALRPLRRAITLRHLRRPFWEETVDQRVSNWWQLVLVGLRDAGWRTSSDESPREFARRVEVDGVERCASILDRARHGIRIDHDDLDAMGAEAETAYRSARGRTGRLARFAAWLRWPLA